MARVFISYTHDSEAHTQRISELAGRLRSSGINAWIDQYESFPREGWPIWMERQVRDAERVLIVATEPYFDRLGHAAETDGGLIWNDPSRVASRVVDSSCPLVGGPVKGTGQRSKQPFRRLISLISVDRAKGPPTWS